MSAGSIGWAFTLPEEPNRVSATNILAYETGLIGGKDVLKVGLGLLVLASPVILFIALPWWSLLGAPLNIK